MAAVASYGPRHNQPAPGAPPTRRLKRQAELAIGALRATGRIEPCDHLLLALVRTTAEVADELAVSRATVYKLVGRGALPCVRVLNAIRVRREDLDALMASGGDA